MCSIFRGTHQIYKMIIPYEKWRAVAILLQNNYFQIQLTIMVKCVQYLPVIVMAMTRQEMEAKYLRPAIFFIATSWRKQMWKAS